ncbi:hypothetical protein EJB05_10470 [Eragrostis curvula]|uniref:Uncharacterized protein n=1 Tax=Eragrostis curvula TaxID=38414 RepID=A0A5J9VLQ1_9POAL|nr:hypothetical protein EJB05_10470 [Eragrostis curvula]
MKMAARDRREMSSEDESSPVSGDLRRGPWTVEEDLLLVNYIAAHGEGRWNALARCAGLKRTGKSCRLRWLNYLRPDLRRGNMTAQEQLMILELHSRWGNRWSKIAQHLPGRTDNEIKNYWRTRVQKHARQLGCDVNSQQFKDLMRYLWMPRLLERIHHSDEATAPPPQQQQHQLSTAAAWSAGDVVVQSNNEMMELSCTTPASSSSSVSTDGMQQPHQPIVSPPPVVSNAADWLCTDSSLNNNSRSMMSMCDTWCQPPPHTEFPAQVVGAETSWTEALQGLQTSVYGDMAALPELGGDTMWGADDLWYTHIMGL